MRTITELNVVPEEDGLRFEFIGNGFLYKMVRNIVGTILEIANGKRNLEDLPQNFCRQGSKGSRTSRAIAWVVS